jgi:hypothetical protein
MAENQAVDLRPRTVGEILDDAWRLALADAPVLLFFGALFLVPAFAVILLLLAWPAPAGPHHALLPAAAALLLALTGVGSGACQELFRRRAEDRPAPAGACLTAALRQGLAHTAARATVLAGVLVGLALLVMPGLALWAAATPLHALIAAGPARAGGRLAEWGREAAFDPATAALATLGRLPLLLLAALNLHLLALALLWTAENLAGFDTALIGVTMSFIHNRLYLAGVLMLSWVLLAPYFEAVNFLLHLDARTRQEGLDLFFRVRRAFPVVEPSGVKVGAALLLALTLLLGTSPAVAGEGLEAVRAARVGVEEVRREVKAAEPYPGSARARCQERLRGLVRRLEQDEPGRFRWFARAVDAFGELNREAAVQVLDTLDNRLSLLEEAEAPPDGQGQPAVSPEQVKSALPRHTAPRRPTAERAADKKEPQRREPPPAEREELGRRRRTGPAGSPQPAAPGAGLGNAGWVVLAGLAVAVLGVAAYLYLSNRQPRTERRQVAAPTADLDVPELPRPGEKSPEELWRQARTLAGEGRHPEALRLLYLAVLFLLDRRRLLRYEPTRTNGEYVRQVRLADSAPEDLHAPFEQLTRLFETGWYGGVACEPRDFQEGERLAGQVRDCAGKD